MSATHLGLDHLDRIRGDAGVVDSVPMASVRGWARSRLYGGDTLELYIESCDPERLRQLAAACELAADALEEEIAEREGRIESERAVADREVNR